MTSSQQTIWGTLEPSLVDIIEESWQYLLKWVFSKNHVFGENEKEFFRIAITAISCSTASQLNIINETRKLRVEFVSQYCFINIGQILAKSVRLLEQKEINENWATSGAGAL